MTVFGAAFSHRFKLMSFRRQNQPIAHSAPSQPPPPQPPSAAASATVTSSTSTQPDEDLRPQHRQLAHSNASNSIVVSQKLPSRKQRHHLADTAVDAQFGPAQRPTRQIIVIPGDADNDAKQSDEESDDKDFDKNRDRSQDRASANASAGADNAEVAPTEGDLLEVAAGPGPGASAEQSGAAECPTGKHKNKKDTVCSCILLEQFADKLATPVISEWHNSALKPANSSSSASSIVALNDFKLARNRVFQGGQGVVYIVRRSSASSGPASEELVMKFKERRKKQRTKSWKRDLREVFLLKDLRHPFIIDLKHAYLTDNFYCLVMDYGSRGSLWSMVCRHGCMPKAIAAYYVACILSAVRYVHRNNFIFRDLKAENVVVMSDYRPKLIDFGMAKSHNKPSVRNTTTSFYFAAYIAPEVYADPKGVTEKVDSWGIGYLALELTVGLGVFKSLPWSQTKHTAPEWRFEMPRRYASRIGRDACRFIEKALDRRPEKRPSLDQLMDFQFLEDIDFRLLPSLKPQGIEAYLAKKADS